MADDPTENENTETEDETPKVTLSDFLGKMDTYFSEMKNNVDTLTEKVKGLDRTVRTTGPAEEPPAPPEPKPVNFEDLFE